MPNGLFRALNGAQRPQTAPQVNPIEYRAAIQQQVDTYRREGRNPTQEFDALMRSGRVPAQQLEVYRKIGHAVAYRLFGGKR